MPHAVYSHSTHRSSRSCPTTPMAAMPGSTIMPYMVHLSTKWFEHWKQVVSPSLNSQNKIDLSAPQLNRNSLPFETTWMKINMIQLLILYVQATITSKLDWCDSSSVVDQRQHMTVPCWYVEHMNQTISAGSSKQQGHWEEIEKSTHTAENTHPYCTHTHTHTVVRRWWIFKRKDLRIMRHHFTNQVMRLQVVYPKTNLYKLSVSWLSTNWVSIFAVMISDYTKCN